MPVYPGALRIANHPGDISRGGSSQGAKWVTSPDNVYRNLAALPQLIAFSVELRVREIAIRMALGSPREGIVRLILRSAVRLAGVGCVAGVLGSLFVSRLMGSLLFQVNPFDPLVLMFAAIAILFLVVAASALPAIQAASVDPMEALRTE